jgi:hypothetical protein
VSVSRGQLDLIVDQAYKGRFGRILADQEREASAEAVDQSQPQQKAGGSGK